MHDSQIEDLAQNIVEETQKNIYKRGRPKKRYIPKKRCRPKNKHPIIHIPTRAQEKKEYRSTSTQDTRSNSTLDITKTKKNKNK